MKTKPVSSSPMQPVASKKEFVVAMTAHPTARSRFYAGVEYRMLGEAVVGKWNEASGKGEVLQEATNKEIVDAATFSGGRYKEHSHTTTAAHASRGIRVPDADKKVVMDRAERAMDDAGMKPVKDDPVSGAKRYESAKQSGEIFFNNGVLHVSVKTK